MMTFTSGSNKYNQENPVGWAAWVMDLFLWDSYNIWVNFECFVCLWAKTCISPRVPDDHYFVVSLYPTLLDLI